MVNWLNSMFHKILLLIDAAVYWFVSMCYQLFVRMSTLQLFNDDFFGEFANRIYAILGVFMLFYLAYALLNALIDPEKLTGDKGVSKIASNLVISLVLLGLVPTIFDYAYRLQNYILSSNILGAIILNTSTNDVNNSQDAMVKFGDSFSFTVMNTFINPDDYNVEMSNGYNWYDYKKDVLENSDYMNLPALSDAIVKEQVDVESGEDVQVEYYVLISTAAGIFMCYMILSFTLDLGVRVFKLAFCQLMAPIPIIMRAMPGKKSTFDKWLKLTLTVFLEVFIRVAFMYLAVYFIRAIYLNWNGDNFSGIQGKIALAIIIMGIFAFAKQAPKMLSDILGIESGNLKLGIGEKLKAGGAFAGGAVLGAGATGLVKNMVNGFKTGRGLLGSTTSAMAGATSSMFNAYRNGAKDAKNFGDVKKSAAAGVQVSVANRERRANYQATHESQILSDAGFPNAARTLGAAAGHISDAINSVSAWAGISPSINELNAQLERVTAAFNARKAVWDRADWILNNGEKLNRTVSHVKYDDSSGVEQQAYNQNVGLLAKELEIMRTTGKDSNGATVSSKDLFDKELLYKAIEKQAKIDIVNGLKTDGVTRTPASEYDGNLAAELTKLVTNINAATNDLTSNVKVKTTELNDAMSFAQNYKNADMSDLAAQGTDIYKMLDGIQKSSIEAQNNINSTLNKVYQQQKKD